MDSMSETRHIFIILYCELHVVTCHWAAEVWTCEQVCVSAQCVTSVCVQHAVCCVHSVSAVDQSFLPFVFVPSANVRFSHKQQSVLCFVRVTIICLHVWFSRCAQYTAFMNAVCWVNIHACSCQMHTMSRGGVVSHEDTGHIMWAAQRARRYFLWRTQPLVWARKMAAASSRGQEGDETKSLSQQDEMKCREAGNIQRG